MVYHLDYLQIFIRANHVILNDEKVICTPISFVSFNPIILFRRMPKW